MIFLSVFTLLVCGLGYLARGWQFVRVDGTSMTETEQARERLFCFVVGFGSGVGAVLGVVVYILMGGAI